MGSTQVVGRNALIGSIIAAGFGIGWIEWGALNLSARAWIAVRVLGAVIGVVIIARGIRLRRAQAANPGPAEASMFTSQGYRLVVAAEVLALGAGGIVLGVTNRIEYQSVWFAFIVGLHFVIFGKLFAARFYVVGGALIVAAVAGLVVGLAGGGIGITQAVTGFVAAISLFSTALLTLLQYRTPQAQPA